MWTATGEQEWTQEVAAADTGSSRSRRQAGGHSAERERLREEDEKGKGRETVDLAHFPRRHRVPYCTQEKAGASSSCTTAVPSSFPKHLAISPRKEGAWDSMQPRDMTPMGSRETQERKIPPRHGSGRWGQDRGTSAGLALRRTGMHGHSCRKTTSP